MRHAGFAARVLLASGLLATARDASATVTLAPPGASVLPPQLIPVTATVSLGGQPLPLGTWTLKFIGLPAGVTAVPATPTYIIPVGMPTTSVAVPFEFVVAAGTVPGGPFSIAVSDTGTASSAVFSLTNQGPPDFVLRLDPASLSLQAGESRVTQVSVQPVNGFAAVVQVGAPAISGITFSPSTFNLLAGGTQPVTVAAAPGTPPNTYSGLFTGTAVGIPFTRTAGISVTVTPPPDFRLSAVPSTLNLPAGSSSPVTVSAASLGGFAGTISVAVQPDGGVTTDVPSFTFAPGQPRVVTVSSPAGTAPGTAHVTFSGTAPGVAGPRTAVVTVTIVPQPDFSLDVQPTAIALPAGGSAPATVALVPINGWNTPVDVTASGSAGISVVPPAFSLQPGAPKPVEIRADPTTPPGAVTLTFQARGTSGSGGGTVTRTVNVQVSVAPLSDFNVRATPSPARVVAGRSTDLTLVLEPVGAFTGSAAITVLEAPPGATFAPPAPVLSPNAPRTMTLSVPRSAPPGTYVVVMRADEVTAPAPRLARRPLAISKTLRIPLDVQPPVAGFTVTASPTAVLASPGQVIAINYVFRNLGGDRLRVVGDTFTRSSAGGTIFDSVAESVDLVLPPNGTLTYTNAVQATGEMFAKAGSPPLVRADRAFRAAPDASGYVDTASASVAITAVNPLLATASATRISVVFPIAGSLVARGENLRAQGLVFTTGSGLFLVGWYWDGILVETASVPVQNGTPAAVSNAISLPTLIAGTHEITLAVLSPNPLASPPVQIYVDDVGSSLRTVSPPRGSAFVPAVQPPTFSWVPVPGISTYKIGLARRGKPEEQRWFDSPGTQWSPPAAVWNRLPEGEYEWTVRGYSGTGRTLLDEMSGGASAPPTSEGSPAAADGWTVSSAPARFSLGGFAERLGPLDGSARAGETGVTFSWGHLEKAIYMLYVFERAGGGVLRLLVEMTTKDELTVAAGRLPAGKALAWRVIALDGDGRPVAATPLLDVPGGVRR